MYIMYNNILNKSGEERENKSKNRKENEMESMKQERK